MTEIAIIGLGAMGSRMAIRLVEAGHRVVVSSRRREAAQALEDAGAMWAGSPREAAQSAELVLAMVTDDEASRQVWLDPECGALAGLREGAVAIESSTLTPGWVRELAEAVAEHGGHLVEAPVVGSRPRAEAGQLVYLVGGAPEAVERVRPVLAAMGGAIHPTGAIGRAANLKLAINTLFAAQVAVWAEVLGTLGRAGIEPEVAAELLTQTPVASPALRGVVPTIVAGRFAPLFPIDLVHKDLGYFVESALGVGARVPTATAVRDGYALAQRAGHGGDNIAGIAQVVG